MPIDASIPMGIRIPEFDAAKPLLAAENFGLHAQDFRKKEAVFNALQEYGKALKSGDEKAIQESIGKVGAVDPEQGKTLLGLRQGVRQAGAQDTYGKTHNPDDVAHFPDVLHTVNQAKAIKDENERKGVLNQLDVAGRHAQAYLANPTPEAWDKMVDNMIRDGIPKDRAEGLRGKPNIIQAERARRAGMAVRDSMEATGEVAANRPAEMAPTSTMVVPHAMYNQNIGMPVPLSGGAAPGAPTASTVPTAAPGAAAAGAAPAPNPLHAEIPATNYDKTGPAGPGVIRQGQDPTMMKAKEAAMEHYQKEVQPAADASAKAKGELQIIRSALEKQGSGQLSTGATAGIRETASGLIYEVAKLAGDKDPAATAESVTGINPSTADVYGKASTRLGFDMSREQGAREAVQVLQYAFRANPNLFNTKAGNMVVTGVLEGVADWKIERAKYANAWLEKNRNLIGFDSWYNTEHPVEGFTSKAYPSQMPTNPAELKKGVTYEGQTKDGTKFKGKWNPDTKSFD